MAQVNLERVLEFDQQFLGELGVPALFAQLVDDLTLALQVMAALLDVAASHFQVGFREVHGSGQRSTGQRRCLRRC